MQYAFHGNVLSVTSIKTTHHVCYLNCRALNCVTAERFRSGQGGATLSAECGARLQPCENSVGAVLTRSLLLSSTLFAPYQLPCALAVFVNTTTSRSYYVHRRQEDGNVQV